MMSPFRESLGMRLRTAYLAMHRTFQEHFARWGLTADQFVVLSLLAEEDGIIQRELVARTFSDPNTVTALLGLLEKKGLVTRIRSERDARARCIHLTPAGRRAALELARESEGLHRRLAESVAEEQLATLLENLSSIADTMIALRRGRVSTPHIE
ncbi:MAG: MarR family transcriptional regulator [Isosphaeraceae bacterium]|nr:MarR family transcriptional regulator [Isosphaeraceae bacterium]